ncbi:adenosine deaminase [Corynebacterium antarcticum]|uniref:adenosine deaminase n=1 Tax=Corynebacterium antarcticum TaxID=2800405 RepID=UPI002003DD17|nr:adenosine deaminase [Corynebacterium antarcticum]MCK7661087.1 adenosine deaminase [Corynebacterium antarcticum]MCX7540408.1 adenosine deaminase [Corynebacterium antarcticum]
MDISSRQTPNYTPEHKSLTRETVATLPKVVLHDHLDGGLRPRTVIELATECGYGALPATDPDALRGWFVDAADSGSLEKYLETFAHTCAVMQTIPALHRVAREAVEDLAEDGVVYAELRFAPEQHRERGLELGAVVDAVVEGIIEGEKTAALAGRTIRARVILCAMRHADRAQEIADLLVGYRNDGDREHRGYVVGFDIAGAEDGFPPSCCTGAFETLRRELVPFTIHAGEAAGIDSLEGAVREGTWRIGHGARLYEDFTADLDTGIEPGRVSAFVRDRQIVLELAPSSNLQTGVVDDLVDHPLPLLQQLGFACTVNTDNRLMSGTTMTDEMMLLVDTFGYGVGELFELTATAIGGAFIPEPERREIMSTLIVPGWDELAENGTGGTTGPVTVDGDRDPGASFELPEEDLAGIDPQLLAELGIDPDDLRPRG